MPQIDTWELTKLLHDLYHHNGYTEFDDENAVPLEIGMLEILAYRQALLDLGHEIGISESFIKHLEPNLP